MKRTGYALGGLVLLAAILAGCGAIASTPTPSGPVATPAGGFTLPASATLVFNLIPPVGTPENAPVALAVLDDVTGFLYNPTLVPMQRLSDGRWQARLTSPTGSLLRYRYLQQAPTDVDEADTYGDPVPYRVLYVEGSMQVDDIAAAWVGSPYTGTMGRIQGRLIDSADGEPLAEILVSAAGLTTFTAGDGTFRLDGLPPGLHMLTAFAPDGSYRPVQQGAVIAPESSTPADLSMDPAPLVQVAFEVTLPEDTLPGAPIRMAGNIRPFGHLFGELPGGVVHASEAMPTLTTVDATHAILVTSLYAGTDLRYKYTLGDGLWNAERASDGAIITRQLIVPEQEVIVSDTVASWQGSASGALAFNVTVPDNTPAEDVVSIQFNPFVWFEPIPMWRLGTNEWFFRLSSPLDFGGSLGYRFCRNQACGGADDVETAGANAVGLRVTPAAVDQDLSHVVRAWEWWSGPTPETMVVAPTITPRPGFEVGYELLTARASWGPRLTGALARLAEAGANAVTLSPTWTLRQANPVPVMTFDPRSGPYQADVRAAVDAAHRNGLRANLRPTLVAPSGSVEAWWASATRDDAWWTVWFESYRALAVTYARLAAEAGADKLILGGPETFPALPNGRLPDGSLSGAPAFAALRWGEILAAVRERYDGPIAFEIELGQELLVPPQFLEEVDQVHVYWHAPLGAHSDLTLVEMQTESLRLLSEILLRVTQPTGRPVVLSVEYLSVDGAATACAPGADGRCLPPAAFDQGRDPSPTLSLDFEEQTTAFNAVLAEAYNRSEVAGFYARGFNPLVALQDKSASLNGKPAANLLRFWYLRIRGQ